MGSLVMLVAAGFLTSTSALLHNRPAGEGTRRRRIFRTNSLSQICAGIVALGAILLSVQVQSGAFR
jgi:hypothetical protein